MRKRGLCYNLPSKQRQFRWATPAVYASKKFGIALMFAPQLPAHMRGGPFTDKPEPIAFRRYRGAQLPRAVLRFPVEDTQACSVKPDPMIPSAVTIRCAPGEQMETACFKPDHAEVCVLPDRLVNTNDFEPATRAAREWCEPRWRKVQWK